MSDAALDTIAGDDSYRAQRAANALKHRTVGQPAWWDRAGVQAGGVKVLALLRGWVDPEDDPTFMPAGLSAADLPPHRYSDFDGTWAA